MKGKTKKCVPIDKKREKEGKRKKRTLPALNDGVSVYAEKPGNLPELKLTKARTAMRCDMKSKRGVHNRNKIKQTFHYTHTHTYTYAGMHTYRHALLRLPCSEELQLSLKSTPGGSYTNITRHHHSEGIFQNCFCL